MRLAMITMTAVCALLPATAIAAEPDTETGRVAEELRKPERQAQIAAAAEAVTDAVLSMPAAPLLRAAKEVAGENPDEVDPDLKVGDIVDPETADKSYEFAHRLPQMMGAMAGMAAAMEGILPELRERIEQSLPDIDRY